MERDCLDSPRHRGRESYFGVVDESDGTGWAGGGRATARLRNETGGEQFSSRYVEFFVSYGNVARSRREPESGWVHDHGVRLRSGAHIHLNCRDRRQPEIQLRTPEFVTLAPILAVDLAQLGVIGNRHFPIGDAGNGNRATLRDQEIDVEPRWRRRTRNVDCVDRSADGFTLCLQHSRQTHKTRCQSEKTAASTAIHVVQYRARRVALQWKLPEISGFAEAVLRLHRQVNRVIIGL